MERFLQCFVAKGMLESEYAIKFASADGEVSAFVARSKVQLAGQQISSANSQVPGRIQVRLLDENANDGLVQLPAQLVNGSDIVKVSKTLLTQP